jgi:hypothetical protein
MIHLTFDHVVNRSLNEDVWQGGGTSEETVHTALVSSARKPKSVGKVLRGLQLQWRKVSHFNIRGRILISYFYCLQVFAQGDVLDLVVLMRSTRKEQTHSAPLLLYIVNISDFC